MKNSVNPKILMLDVETSPLISYTWGLYDQNVIERLQTFQILSVAYKWLGKKTQVIACDTQSERSLLLKLRKLLNEADILVAHNGDAFDIKKINARLIVHKIPPPSPYKSIDTKKEARLVAAFDSNSLNNLGIDMGEGEKIKHRGFDMWKGCMAGNKKDWADMKRYNIKDVDLLEKIYLRIRPWIKNHPNTSVNNHLNGCPKCGSTQLIKRGKAYSGMILYTRFQCKNCHGWGQTPYEKSGQKIKNA